MTCCVRQAQVLRQCCETGFVALHFVSDTQSLNLYARKIVAQVVCVRSCVTLTPPCNCNTFAIMLWLCHSVVKDTHI